MVIWCVTLEHEHKEHLFDPNDFGMSLVGLFKSKETAIKYINRHTDKNIEWEKSWKDKCYEGKGATGNYYLLFRHEIIGEDDKGEYYKVTIEEVAK